MRQASIKASREDRFEGNVQVQTTAAHLPFYNQARRRPESVVTIESGENNKVHHTNRKQETNIRDQVAKPRKQEQAVGD